MSDWTIIGTASFTAHVAAYDNGRTPDDGDPDRIVETEVWLEVDLTTEITDPDRIAAIKAYRAEQAKELT